MKIESCVSSAEKCRQFSTRGVEAQAVGSGKTWQKLEKGLANARGPLRRRMNFNA
jgi:hypothetical protein